MTSLCAVSLWKASDFTACVFMSVRKLKANDLLACVTASTSIVTSEVVNL